MYTRSFHGLIGREKVELSFNCYELALSCSRPLKVILCANATHDHTQVARATLESQLLAAENKTRAFLEYFNAFYLLRMLKSQYIYKSQVSFFSFYFTPAQWVTELSLGV